MDDLTVVAIASSAAGLIVVTLGIIATKTLHPKELPMNQPNPATESAEQPRCCGGEFVESSDGTCANCDAYRERHAPDEQPQAPQRPSSIGYVQLVDSWCYDDSPEAYMNALEAQLSAKDEELGECKSGANGWAEIAGEYKERAEQAEAELTRVKAKRDRMREALKEVLFIAETWLRHDFETARAAPTPPPAKEKP